MLALRTINVTKTVITHSRALSTTTLLRQGSDSSSGGNDSFKKREQAAENQFVRDSEKEKLKALRKSIEASKKHLQELESHHDQLEASIGKEGDKAK